MKSASVLKTEADKTTYSKQDNMKKWIVFIILIIIGIVLYHYIYQDHRNIESEDAEYTLFSNEIINEFKINPSDAETKYLNKTIEISGNISEINTNQMTLNQTIYCQFSSLKPNYIVNQTVKIKGRFIGYDSLLEEIKLDQCSIINKP